MKIPHELVTVIEERGKQLLLKVTAQSVGRPFRALIHKPGDLPVICTEFISMPRVKLAVRLLIHGLAMPFWGSFGVYLPCISITMRFYFFGKGAFLLPKKRKERYD